MTTEQPAGTGQSAHDRWVAQNRAKLVSSLGEDHVAEWESVIAGHRLPDGHLPDHMVLLLMDAAYSQGICTERWRVLRTTREPS